MNGTGLLALTNDNTFLGRATVAFGILDLRNPFALGAADNSTSNDTTKMALGMPMRSPTRPRGGGETAAPPRATV